MGGLAPPLISPLVSLPPLPNVYGPVKSDKMNKEVIDHQQKHYMYAKDSYELIASKKITQTEAE